jgi:hypothetical protein
VLWIYETPFEKSQKNKAKENAPEHRQKERWSCCWVSDQGYLLGWSKWAELSNKIWQVLLWWLHLRRTQSSYLL